MIVGLVKLFGFFFVLSPCKMILKEPLKTPHEADLEIQRIITEIMEHSFQSDKMIKEKKYIKAYKREEKLLGELAWLAEYLNGQNTDCKKELNTTKELLSGECLKKKCEMLQRVFESKEYDENEDFGDE